MQPLLQALDALAFVARHLNPPDFAAVMDAVGGPDEALRAAHRRPDSWPEDLADMRSRIRVASDAALAAFDGLRAAADQPEGLVAVFRALRQATTALEALYPLADVLPAVSRFFLDPAMRDDADLQLRLTRPGREGGTGITHLANDPGSRGGFSLYVPEYYSGDRAWPLVMALHGG
ncbi:MAG TPA: phospholipase, partial [Xanthobacteraceae bacterium]|nr:phospholipase [Xanthobacteraceae bacterium]